MPLVIGPMSGKNFKILESRYLKINAASKISPSF